MISEIPPVAIVDLLISPSAGFGPQLTLHHLQTPVGLYSLSPEGMLITQILAVWSRL